jgi:general secretion pathway protein D
MHPYAVWLHPARSICAGPPPPESTGVKRTPTSLRSVAMPFAFSAHLVLFCLCAQAEHSKTARTLYKAGQLAEMREDYATAYEDYYEAFEKDPADLRYKTGYDRLRVAAAGAHISLANKLQATGDKTQALTELMRALEIDPSNTLARSDVQALEDKIAAAGQAPHSPVLIAEKPRPQLGAPVQLNLVSSEPVTLHMTEDSKIVYKTLGKAAGINVLFDPEYTSRRIEVDLANVSLADALRIVATTSGTFWHALTPNTIFVAMDTRAKRQQLEEEAVETFYLKNIAQQNDLNDIQTALRNLLTNAKLYGVPSQGAIVMRATPDELLLAQSLIDNLDKARPEVIVDVALLEVNRDKIRNIGLSLPTSFSTQLQTSDATSTSSTSTTTTTTTSTENFTLNNLAHLNATNVAVTVGAATANLLLSDSDTKVLQNPSIRVTDGQKADLKVGQRIPVATGSYSTGTSTTTVSSLVNTQFTYLDVGVEIELTPSIHYDRDSTLKIKIVSSEESGSTTISGVTEPIISQRTTEQVVRLKDGEVNILGGFLQKQDLLTVSGWPGLGELPVLKYLFSSRQRELEDDELVFMLTPRLVRGISVSPENLQQVDTGAGGNVELRRMDSPATTHLRGSLPLATGTAAAQE